MSIRTSFSSKVKVLEKGANGVVNGAALLYITTLIHLLQLLLFAFSLDMDGLCWEDLNYHWHLHLRARML